MTRKPDKDDLLHGVLAYWKKRLLLQDWTICAKYVRARDMPTSTTQGRVRVTSNLKRATIHMLDPMDYDTAYGEPEDPEVTLVHELLHIHFDVLCPNEDDRCANVLFEQGIESVARALVAEHRQEK